MFSIVPFNRRSQPVAVRNLMDDFFNDNFFGTALWGIEPTQLRSDVRESKEDYRIDVDLPGVRKEDIALDLREDVLTLQVSRQEASDDENSRYIRKERRMMSSSRSYVVPGVDKHRVTAVFEDGVLKLTLPKAEKSEENPYRIDIQ